MKSAGGISFFGLTFHFKYEIMRLRWKSESAGSMKKKKQKKRNGIAKALQSKTFRQRVKPNKKHKPSREQERYNRISGDWKDS